MLMNPLVQGTIKQILWLLVLPLLLLVGCLKLIMGLNGTELMVKLSMQPVKAQVG